MNDKEFRCFLDLLMCSDPWPVPGGANESILIDFADKEAKRRRFANWIDAYHNFKPFRMQNTRHALDCTGVDPEKQSTGKCDSRVDGLPIGYKGGPPMD